MATRTRSLGDIVTPYRVVYTAALVVAALLLVVGFQGTRDDRKAGCAVGSIVQLIPCPGDSILRQGTIGVALSSGYQVALVVDRTEIPQDQVRTGGPNQVYFQPGPGTEIGTLAPGNHTATVLYWPTTGTRERNAKSYSWAFGVV